MPKSSEKQHFTFLLKYLVCYDPFKLKTDGNDLPDVQNLFELVLL